jgi:hypothetical protein
MNQTITGFVGLPPLYGVSKIPSITNALAQISMVQNTVTELSATLL